jgi:hypothetical protein
MRKLLMIFLLVPMISLCQTPMKLIRGGNHPPNKKIAIGAPILDSIFYTGLIRGMGAKKYVGIVMANATDSVLYEAIKSQMHPMKQGYYIKGKDEIFIMTAR